MPRGRAEPGATIEMEPASAEELQLEGLAAEVLLEGLLEKQSTWLGQFRDRQVFRQGARSSPPPHI